MQGPDAGKMVGFSDIGGGLAVPDASIAIQETNFWVTGDVNKFNIDALRGGRNAYFLGGTYGFIDGTGTLSISKEVGPWGQVIGGSLGLGVGIIPIWVSGGWNIGKTTIYK